MAKQLQLTIPEPCHEDWEAMTPVEKGRFCGACQKQVVDFSNMSDRQVAEFFKKPSTGSVCGRFMSDQLDRDIEIPKKRIPWVKYFFTVALPAFLLTLKPGSAKAQGAVYFKTSSKNEQATIKQDKPLVGDTSVIVKNAGQEVTYGKTNIPLATALASRMPVCGLVPQKQKSIDTSDVRMLSIPVTQEEIPRITLRGNVNVRYYTARFISGRFVDEDGKPAQGVIARIRNTRIGTAGGDNGYFYIQANIGDTLIVSGRRYITDQVIVPSSNSITIVVKKVPFCGTTVKKNREKISTPKHLNLPDSITKDSFKLFPNPVSSGSPLTIECRKADEGNYSVILLNQSGQAVHQQEVSVERKMKRIQFHIPVITAGSYFVVLTNKATGKKYNEKIIVQ